MHNFRKLAVWHRGKGFARDVYFLCATVTNPRQKTVTAQLWRSALAISATIAEGCGKRTRAETIRYLEMACGSVTESESHLLVAADLGILPAANCAPLVDEATQLRRMLRALIERLPP